MIQKDNDNAIYKNPEKCKFNYEKHGLSIDFDVS